MSLEKYSVEKLIGKGSYGEVFLAKHKKDKRTVRLYDVIRLLLHDLCIILRYRDGLDINIFYEIIKKIVCMYKGSLILLF